MAAARVSVRWLGTKKSLTPEQKRRAAETFGAEGRDLTAAKRLLDTSHPAFKSVTAVKNGAVQFWRTMSLPFGEPGIRLLGQDRIERSDAQTGDFAAELEQAVARLEEHYTELRAAARGRLGSLYHERDYPESLGGLFGLEWDFPSVEPPDFLRQLNLRLYRQRCQQMRQRFEQAVVLAEDAFTTELARPVSHLTERLSGREDGRPKVFRDSAVANLVEFFDRFGVYRPSRTMAKSLRSSMSFRTPDPNRRATNWVSRPSLRSSLWQSPAGHAFRRGPPVASRRPT